MNPAVFFILFALLCLWVQRRFVSRVYLDSAATTCPLFHLMVRQALTAVLTYGNPSSKHRMGEAALQTLSDARSRVARALGVQPCQVYFTSGATESNNFAIKGAAASRITKERPAVITTRAEHSSVHEVVAGLRGAEVRYADMLPDGRVDLDHVRRLAGKGDVGLACFMWLNNETGVVTDPAAVREAVGEGAWLHVDATQLVGKARLDLAAAPFDSLVFSSHKFHGPRGVGATVLREGCGGLSAEGLLPPLIDGGHQERGLRSGTENVAALDAMSRALVESVDLYEFYEQYLAELKAYLVKRAADELGARVNGDPRHACAWITNLCLPGVDAADLVARLSAQDIFVNTASACNRGARSRVLEAMAVPEDLGGSALRVSFSHDTVAQDVDCLMDAVAGYLEDLRAVACHKKISAT